ncbi:MAG: type II toxin-antitoxin system VapC family toxin [Desulfosalsimonadaceae bacterium]|nr:type II toxin-antitoxin system VapC family toxin [Desulfosalsimonadaceae bacterium]
MNGSYILDTNIIIALFALDAKVQKQLGQANEVFIPSIVLGELYYGAHKSVHVESNTQRIEELASNSAILACDAECAKHYGIIKNRLRAKGRPIPENDIWIAAQAIQYDLILVTRDTHFKAIESLPVEIW